MLGVFRVEEFVTIESMQVGEGFAADLALEGPRGGNKAFIIKVICSERNCGAKNHCVREFQVLAKIIRLYLVLRYRLKVFNFKSRLVSS